MKLLRLVILAAACTWTFAVHARITEINVQKVEPFANGATFGNTGAYERVWGVAKGELDPADARNKVIVNINKALRNARGKVEYEVEWFMLRPADASMGNHKLLFEVTNRGRKFLMNWIMDAPTQAGGAVNDPKTFWRKRSGSRGSAWPCRYFWPLTNMPSPASMPMPAAPKP